MRAIVLVSSLTGNTYKVARYVQKGIGETCDLKRVGDEVDLSLYDLCFVGFWLDSGHVENKALELISALENKTVGLFGTLGGNPKSAEAQKVMQTAIDALNNPQHNNTLLGSFWVQGKISRSVLEKMYAMFPHLKDDENHIKRIAQAATHPDAADRLKALLIAQKWYRKALKLRG